MSRRPGSGEVKRASVCGGGGGAACLAGGKGVTGRFEWDLEVSKARGACKGACVEVRRRV